MLASILAAALATSAPAQSAVANPPPQTIAGAVPATSAGRAAGRLDVRDYGATGDGKSDDSAAFAAAINAANASAGAGGDVNTPACLFVSAGIYRIAATHLPMFYRNGCIVGEGPLKTIVLVDPEYAGDLFAWSEAWMARSYPFAGDTVDVFRQAAGPIVKDISIVGTRSAVSAQNAFVFYDRVDFLTMEDVSVDYLRGRALYSGARRQAPEAYMRESRLTNLRFFHDGGADVPVVEFTSAGNGDASNEIDVTNLDIYAPYGPGVVVRSQNPKSAVRAIKFTNLRIEGEEDNPHHVAADLLTVGDATMAGRVDGITFSQLELIDPYAGCAAMRLTASAPKFQPYEIRAEGIIGGGKPTGRGLQIDAGRDSYFHLTEIHTAGTAVSVAGPPMTADGIVINGDGAETTWTYDVDPRAARFISSPVRRVGVPGSATSSPAIP